MRALSPSRLTLVCFILGLFLSTNKLDSWDSFNTKTVSAGLKHCTFLKIAGKLADTTCRFTQQRGRISDTFNERAHNEPHRVNE